MRIPRIYLSHPLAVGDEVALDADATRHAVTVLRLRPGAPLVLFNGRGGEYPAVLLSASHTGARARVEGCLPDERESPLHTVLVQGISRGERMDATLRKAVELGVSAIQPLLTEHCQVRLEGERLTRRHTHWQSIVVSACEQCGRNRVPPVLAVRPFTAWVAQPAEGLRLLLDPAAGIGLSQLPQPQGPIALLTGPEGGLSNAEVAAAHRAGFIGVRLGPRVLRTETAGLAALAALQCQWGDWN